jgi:3-deoxy-D-manno-octulosonic-acid transferase
VPLVLVNARMSDKSLRQAQRLAWLARAAFASLRAVWAQTEGDAIALRQLGANVKAVFGNLKFDANPKPEQIEQGRRWRAQHRRPVLMLASSRAGEEQSLLTLLAAASRPTGAESPVVNDVGDLQQAANGCQCLIVPRHPQRFDEVAALIEIHGFRVVRRSQWGVQGPDQLAEVPGKTIWLGDSLGEMALYYAMADVALLGGSFEPLGGQNLIEAAACGCPLIMGPHTFNFAQAAELAMSAGAALRVDSMAQAVAAATALVQDAARQAAMVYAADAFSGAHRGALEKTALAVLDLLEQQGVDAL